MEIGFKLLFNSTLLGVGLAMDAFSVSLANGLSEPCMRRGKIVGIAGVFALFQAAMPLLGWICVHTVAQYFRFFEKLIPWIALGLLGFIGGSMLKEGLTCKGEECECGSLGLRTLLLQGVATSIDALSVGFTIAEYDIFAALLAVSIIAVVTFVLCWMGILIGRKVGTALAGKASIFGGIILIFIGLEIFITSWL